MAREWDVPGYTEVKTLGSGGFGDVVLARHDASGAAVAIKYLRPQLLADPEFAELFRAEAAVLASLDDPNVVRLYEYVESPSGAAIVMELVDGVSLRDILSRQGATTAEAALVVLQGSLLGLAAAHRRGVVHRDYKPENVLVNGGGVSKLTDFGIAARAGDSPIPAGTLAYAPPEQFGGSPATPASDVYAATATFYECLAGRPPFTGDTAERLLYQHLSQPVPLEPVPEPLRPLVTAGMAKDPGDRPTDGTALVAALRRGRRGRVRPGLGGTRPVRAWPRRRCCWPRCGRRAGRPPCRAAPCTGSGCAASPLVSARAFAAVKAAAHGRHGDRRHRRSRGCHRGQANQAPGTATSTGNGTSAHLHHVDIGGPPHRQRVGKDSATFPKGAGFTGPQGFGSGQLAWSADGSKVAWLDGQEVGEFIVGRDQVRTWHCDCFVDRVPG